MSIGNEFSHVNDTPLTIDDFELLKVIDINVKSTVNLTLCRC